ncbi:MAG: hypothetical protein KJO98_16580 [Rhodothermia bacterium]|nr:hypothetical protein [Rhodothermia bacterium]NNE18050.1 hypothetical protein [Myxococcales bacterium]
MYTLLLEDRAGQIDHPPIQCDTEKDVVAELAKFAAERWDECAHDDIEPPDSEQERADLFFGVSSGYYYRIIDWVESQVWRTYHPH